jgi:2-polyprenyl-3-methyl-5-hydroxy-6-metoxy-1,4-benzoquinol methylase
MHRWPVVALGFEHASIDIAENITIRLDLNNDRVPENFRGGFDLVINAGTMEHLANQENAFRAIHDLTRPGGLQAAVAPTTASWSINPSSSIA